MSNKNNTTLYVGMTNDIERRLQEHKSGLIKGFTQRYNCDKLVYLESYSDVNQAIDREKQIKKWRREKKDGFLDSLRSLEMTKGYQVGALPYVSSRVRLLVYDEIRAWIAALASVEQYSPVPWSMKACLSFPAPLAPLSHMIDGTP